VLTAQASLPPPANNLQ